MIAAYGCTLFVRSECSALPAESLRFLLRNEVRRKFSELVIVQNDAFKIMVYAILGDLLLSVRSFLFFLRFVPGFLTVLLISGSFAGSSRKCQFGEFDLIGRGIDRLGRCRIRRFSRSLLGG